VVLPHPDIAIILWPFIDRRADSPRGRRIRILLVLVVMAGIAVLTVMGMRA
jgi:quinol-cytochrome oxidoreductase complex cytochrome b subunit